MGFSTLYNVTIASRYLHGGLPKAHKSSIGLSQSTRLSPAVDGPIKDRGIGETSDDDPPAGVVCLSHIIPHNTCIYC